MEKGGKYNFMGRDIEEMGLEELRYCAIWLHKYYTRKQSEYIQSGHDKVKLMNAYIDLKFKK